MTERLRCGYTLVNRLSSTSFAENHSATISPAEMGQGLKERMDQGFMKMDVGIRLLRDIPDTLLFVGIAACGTIVRLIRATKAA